MNEIVGNLQPMVVVNPPMRKVVDLSTSKRKNAEVVAEELGSWLGDQGFVVERQGKVIMSNGPPTELQNRMTAFFGHGEEPTFNEDKTLVEYTEDFDKQFAVPNPPPKGWTVVEFLFDDYAGYPHWFVVGDFNTRKEALKVAASNRQKPGSPLTKVVPLIQCPVCGVKTERYLDDAEGRPTEFQCAKCGNEWVLVNPPKPNLAAEYKGDYSHLPEEIFGYGIDQAKDRNVTGMHIEPGQIIHFDTAEQREEFDDVINEKINDMLWEVRHGERSDFDEGYLENLQARKELENPAYRFPKAETAVEKVVAGQMGVALSQMPMPIRMPHERNPEGEPMSNEKEVAVCCEVKDCTPAVENPRWTKSDIQSILFDKAKWTVEKAKEWLKAHDYKFGDVDEKKSVLRFRQIDPSKIIKGHYAVIPFGKISAKLKDGFSIKDIKSGIMATIGQPKANPVEDSDGPLDEEGLGVEFLLPPEENPRENRHYTVEERKRIMSTPQFKSWLRKWHQEKKAAPKQGYFHAFMSDVGHRAGAVGEDAWPSTVRWSDKDKVETPSMKRRYYAIGEKRRTISGKPIIRAINPQEQYHVKMENPKTFWEAGHPLPFGYGKFGVADCPSCGKPFDIERHAQIVELRTTSKCPHCGVADVWEYKDVVGSERPGDDNPKDKSWLMERRKKFRYQTGADTTHPPAVGAREKFWVRGYKRGVRAETPVSGHYRTANPDDDNVGASLALDNPPNETSSPETHQHGPFRFLGLCNPKQGGKTRKLLECVGCHRKFVRD